jgi:hypothetical protein
MNWLKKLFGTSAATGSPQSTQKATTSANPTTGGKYYLAHGLNLAPDAARKLLFEEACKQVTGLKVLSDRGDWVEAAKGEDYSVLLYFNKTGGLFEATISPSTTSGFLGMGMPQPEQVWTKLGYRLQEDLSNKVTWTNGDAKIVAYYGRPGSLNEIHYVIPEKPTTPQAEAAAWRELGFFGGGRGCIESARQVGGMCYADEDAVNRIIRFTKDEWKGTLPQGFWLVKAEADDTSASCRHCLGHDSRHDAIWQTIIEAMEKSGSLPRCVSKPFRLAPNDLFAQTQIEIIHIKGLLNG